MHSITSRRRSVAAVAVSALASGVVLALPGAAAAQDTTDVTVLSFNDFHGRISASGPSTVAFADTIEKMRAEHPGAALTSAGDNVGASLFASSFKQDEPTIEVLNALGLQTSAVGNHEFDGGIDDLQGRIEKAADWSYLGANVTVNGTAMQAYEVLEVNGVKVGIIGAVTADTKTLVSPSGIQGVEFGDPVDAVNRVAGELTDGDAANGEADILVASYHEGAPSAEDPDKAQADSAVFAKIATKTSDKVAAIFTAHTHMTHDWKIAGRPVIQAGSYASHIGRVTFSYDPATKQATVADTEVREVPGSADGVDLSNPVVAQVKQITDDTLAEAEQVGAQPVGAVTGDITSAIQLDGKRDDRLSESALGNLVADYMLEAVADRGGAEIAFMNPGGLRADLLNDPAYAAGQQNITKAEANAVLPFANTLMTMEMTGAQLKQVLEQQWQPAGNSRPFLALGTNSGFTWTFDPSRPAGDRITGMYLDGTAIDETKTYRVATQSFLAGGGDNFFEFANATNKADTGLIDSDTWMAYLGKHSPLDPSNDKHAVIARDVPEEFVAGEKASFTLADINLTSRGAVKATSGTVTLDGKDVGTVTVSGDSTTDASFPTPLDGSATVEVTIPADATGKQLLKVEFDNGTVAYIPVDLGDEPGDGSGSLDLGSLSGEDAGEGLMGIGSLVLGAGLIAALAAAAQFALAGGMIPPFVLAQLPPQIKELLHI